MCGDGTNDVGALKHAAVGVALISKAPLTPPEPVLIKKKRNAELNHDRMNKVVNSVGDKNNKLGNQQLNHGRDRDRGVPRNQQQQQQFNPNQSGRSRKMEEQLNNLQSLMKEMDEADGASVVKLGDASIAAPFTSKLSSIQCGKFVIGFTNCCSTAI